MLEEYDIDNLNPRPNPYAKELQKQAKISIDPLVVNYFAKMESETSIPYDVLINLYLKDCIKAERKIDLTWKSESA